MIWTAEFTVSMNALTAMYLKPLDLKPLDVQLKRSYPTWLQIDQKDSSCVGLVFILVITDSPATCNLMFKCTAILRIKLN